MRTVIWMNGTALAVMAISMAATICFLNGDSNTPKGAAARSTPILPFASEGPLPEDLRDLMVPTSATSAVEQSNEPATTTVTLAQDTPATRPPTWELPLPIMWGDRDEGFAFIGEFPVAHSATETLSSKCVAVFLGMNFQARSAAERNGQPRWATEIRFRSYNPDKLHKTFDPGERIFHFRAVNFEDLLSEYDGDEEISPPKKIGEDEDCYCTDLLAKYLAAWLESCKANACPKLCQDREDVVTPAAFNASYTNTKPSCCKDGKCCGDDCKCCCCKKNKGSASSVTVDPATFAMDIEESLAKFDVLFASSLAFGKLGEQKVDKCCGGDCNCCCKSKTGQATQAGEPCCTPIYDAAVRAVVLEIKDGQPGNLLFGVGLDPATCCVKPAMMLLTYPAANLTKEDVDQLMCLIARMVAPETWQEVGGGGCIGYFAPAKSLVVRQTPEVHKELQDFLSQLGQAMHAQASCEKDCLKQCQHETAFDRPCCEDKCCIRASVIELRVDKDGRVLELRCNGCTEKCTEPAKTRAVKEVEPPQSTPPDEGAEFENYGTIEDAYRPADGSIDAAFIIHMLFPWWPGQEATGANDK